MPRGVYERAPKAAPAPSAPSAPPARRIGLCAECALFVHESGPTGLCKRYPTAIIKSPRDGCAEFSPR